MAAEVQRSKAPAMHGHVETREQQPLRSTHQISHNTDMGPDGRNWIAGQPLGCRMRLGSSQLMLPCTAVMQPTPGFLSSSTHEVGWGGAGTACRHNREGKRLQAQVPASSFEWCHQTTQHHSNTPATSLWVLLWTC